MGIAFVVSFSSGTYVGSMLVEFPHGNDNAVNHGASVSSGIARPIGSAISSSDVDSRPPSSMPIRAKVPPHTRSVFLFSLGQAASVVAKSSALAVICFMSRIADDRHVGRKAVSDATVLQIGLVAERQWKRFCPQEKNLRELGIRSRTRSNMVHLLRLLVNNPGGKLARDNCNKI